MFGSASIGPRVSDVMSGHRAVRTIVVRVRLIDAPYHRFDDLHSEFVKLFLHRMGAVVARAALDDVHFGARYLGQDLLCLGADILHTLVAGRM